MPGSAKAPNAAALPRSASSEAQRLAVAGGVGIVALVASALTCPWQLTLLVTWSAVSLTLLGWIWRDIGHLDAEGTRRIAVREDDSRRVAFLLLVTASVASLGGVVSAFVKQRSSQGWLAPTLLVGGIVAVAASWALVHTLFTLRYAHLYYSDEPGGIDFNEQSPPDYRDFAYLAFTIGMSFAASDTNIEAAPIRRTVLRQALISYVFGTVIVALSINIVAGLL